MDPWVHFTPKPAKITGFLSKNDLNLLLAKSKPIPSKQRKAAIKFKRSKPAPQPKRIMAIFKKIEPLAKNSTTVSPRLVWTGRSGKVKLPAGIYIEGLS